jgi:Tol biopolymer transport system component/DNA-binding winged helix-turn-helix (wHTH) protein
VGSTPGGVVRFGPFEADLESGELRKGGLRIKVQGQPMRVLAALLERPGELVTREELQQLLWPDVVYLDFEHGLNMAVKKLRAALNDSSETPRYIETLARKGYRFIGAIESSAPPVATVETPPARFGWKLWATALSTVALLAAAAILIRQSTLPQLKITALISNPGSMNSLAFSPEGKQLAFVLADKMSAPKIYITALGLGPARRLTDDDDPTHAETMPRWIPDGSGISFMRPVRGGGGLFAVPLGGGTPRKLLDPGPRYGYSWSPDAHSIVVAIREEEGLYAIYRLSVPDGRRKRLTNPPRTAPNASAAAIGGDVLPSCSPDGKWILFVRRLVEGDVLMAMPAAGGQPRPLLHSSDTEDWTPGVRAVDWLPGGREVVISGNVDTPVPSLYRVSVSSGRFSMIENAPVSVDLGDVAVSPAGDRLVYNLQHTHGSIRRYSLVNPGDAARRPAAQSPHDDLAPAYSPDGRRIAFASNRAGNFQIYVAASDGAHPVPITTFPRGMAGWPRWSPDGKWLSFDARPTGHSQIFVVDAEGGTPRALATPQGDAVMPEWSPDGAWLYFTLIAPAARTDIWKIPASGGPSTRITNMGNAYGAIPTPDGATLYVGTRNRQGIYRVPAAGGSPEALPDSQSVFSIAAARSGFYGVTPAEADGTLRQLVHFSYAGRQFQRLFLLPKPVYVPGLAVSTDEKDILVAEDGGAVSQLMMIEHFR